MPYEVRRDKDCPPDKPFGVFKQGTSEKLGCHANEAAAKQQLRALYAQEARSMPSTAVGEGTFKGRDVFSAAEAVFTQETPESPIRADVVIIKPGESANRRFYTQEAIDRAIESGFWEGSPMFIDHPDDMRVPTKRKITTLAAGLSNVRRGPHGEAIGTATFFNREFGKFAMEAKEHVGVSGVHYFKGQRYRGTDKHYHERVDEFLANNSVDFVAFAAAGGGILGFLPAMESEDDVDFEALTPELIKQIAEARPDLRETFTEVAGESQGNPPADPPAAPPKKTAAPVAPVAGLTREDLIAVVGEAIDQRFEQRTKAEGERDAAETKVKDLLAKSGLPEPVRNRLQGNLMASSKFDTIETVAAEAITSAHAELKALGLAPKMAGSGPSTTGDEPTEITLAQAAEANTVIQAFFGNDFGKPAGKES